MTTNELNNNANELNNNANELNNTLDISTLAGIKQAIDTCDNPITKLILETLLKSKETEVTLTTKLAKKATKKAVLNSDESILKAVFVALRPMVDTDTDTDTDTDKAVLAFKAVKDILDIDFNQALQVSLFGGSSVHCVKSNFNKSTNNIGDSYTAFLKSVEQAKILLPDIDADIWNNWIKAVQEAAARAAKKRNIDWVIPADKAAADTDTDTDKAAADKAAADKAAADKAAADKAAADKAAADKAAADKAAADKAAADKAAADKAAADKANKKGKRK